MRTKFANPDAPRAAICLGLVAAATLPFVIQSRFVFHIATSGAIMATLALSLNLMLRMGQLSIAQAAFMGIGAYCSALLTMNYGIVAPVAILLSGACAGFFAILTGPLFLRVKGVYFVLLTYAFTQFVNLAFQHWTSIFGGNSGLYGIPRLSMSGFELAGPPYLYAGALILLAAGLGISALLLSSYVGIVIKALEQDEDLCRSFGLRVLPWRVLVFVISANIAGWCGSYYAHFIGFLSPEAFKFWTSIDVLLMNVIGGVGSIFGPLLGALVLIPLPELLRGAKEYQMLCYGAMLVICMLFFRRGIVGLLFRKD